MRHWRRYYVYRRPFDYRTPRPWVGTAAAAPPVVGSKGWGYILG